MNSDDPALAAFLGACPEDFQYARDRFAAGDYFPMIKSGLQRRNVSAEQVSRIIHDVAGQHIQPLIASQLPREILVNRLIDRGLTGDEADTVLKAVQDRYDRRLDANGLTEPKAYVWINILLAFFGILRIPGVRSYNLPFDRKS